MENVEYPPLDTILHHFPPRIRLLYRLVREKARVYAKKSREYLQEIFHNGPQNEGTVCRERAAVWEEFPEAVFAALWTGSDRVERVKKHCF